MSYLRTIWIAATVFLQASNSYTTNIDQNFERCVSTALEQRGQTAKTIFISTGAKSKSELDHDLSRRTTSYQMQVDSKSSREKLGTVACSISDTGNLLAVSFVR